MSIDISPTNNIIRLIENIDFNARVWDIHRLLPMEIPLALYQMTPPVFLLIKYYMKS